MIEKIKSNRNFEVARLFSIKESNFKMIQVVIAALGTIPVKLPDLLVLLRIPYQLGVIQISALLGIATILVQVMSVCGPWQT